MTYLLDTNVCIDYLTARYSEVVDKIQGLMPEELCVSSIVVAELRFGADKSAKPKRNHRLLDALTNEIRCRDFDAVAASEYGEIRAFLERKGTPIGPNDMLIAAHALSLQAILVTTTSPNSSAFPGSASRTGAVQRHDAPGRAALSPRS